jgi:hypothetical protein
MNFCSKARHAIQLLQGVFRRGIPCKGGVPATLVEARNSIHAVEKDVLHMHLRITGQLPPQVGPNASQPPTSRRGAHTPEEGESDNTAHKVEFTPQQRFLNTHLNMNMRFWSDRPRPCDILPNLREISTERMLQDDAELEVTTMKAASNVMFRAWLRRKLTQVRKRAEQRRLRKILFARFSCALSDQHENVVAAVHTESLF